MRAKISEFTPKLELDPIKQVYSDHMQIELTNRKIRFHVRIDGAGNDFEISMERMKEFMMWGR